MILRMFENMLSRNIDCVAFKINEARHSSKNLNALNSYLAKLQAKKIYRYPFTRRKNCASITE
jgi:hypothetical protein